MVQKKFLIPLILMFLNSLMVPKKNSMVFNESKKKLNVPNPPWFGRFFSQNEAD